MRIQGWLWKCEREGCGHKWMANDIVPPAKCAGCKRRGWHTIGKAEGDVLPVARPRIERPARAIAQVVEDIGETCPFFEPAAPEPKELRYEMDEGT
jgi:hypothetical protein